MKKVFGNERFYRTAALIAAALVLAFTACSNPSGGGGGGGGGDDDPPAGKAITSADELAKIGVESEYPLNGEYYLSGDLELENWKPIGSASTPFTGKLDGDNHTITLKSFDSSALADAIYIGIFGYVKGASLTSKADIKDLTITSSVDQTTSKNAGQAIGLLAGYTENTEISDITLNGSFTFGAQKDIYLGGVVGYAQKGTVVEGCESALTMNIDAGSGSGLEGGMYYGYVGGFVGAFKDGVEIEDCHNSGTITADSTLGSSQVFAGGITGGSYYAFTTVYQGSIQDCSYTGNILAKAKGWWTFAGGIAGTIVSGDVGNDAVTTKIVRCFATGTVSVAGTTSSNPYVGGIVGYNYQGALVSQSYFTGNVIANKSGDYTGGIAGYNSQKEAPNNSRIEDCWSSGTVTGFNNAGGIVGQNQLHTYVRRCYSTATVKATNTGATGVGGIAGANLVNAGFSGTVENCVALNPLIRAGNTSNIHRIAGGGTSTQNYNNLAYSGMAVDPGSGTYTPEIGADKKDGADCDAQPAQPDYVTLGWNFTNVWKMGANDYPVLKWQ